MTDYTTNLNLELVDFNKATWHDDAWDNYKIIDAACAVLGLSIKGLWANSTAVVVGEFWVDGTDGSIWQVNVAHTTAASPTTFSSDRTSNPTYWSQINAVGQWRGVWAATTYYAKNDIVYNSDTYYQCHTAHTSGGSFSATNWTTLVDLSSSVTAAQAAQTAAEAAQTAAEAAQTAAETAETNAETAQTAAETAQSAAETAETNAETAQTAAETAQSAAETAQTAAETAQTAAETAQTGAETAETNAETALETFQATFLGAAASAPTVDGNGDALTGGEIYLNTGDLLVYIYNLGTTTWIPVGQATSPVVGGDTGDGSTTSFALGSSPSSENHVLAYINGQYVPHSEFSVSSGNIVFATAPVSGDEIDWLVLQATDIGTPSDDTVGPDQLDDTQIPEIRGFLDLDLLRGDNAIINGDFAHFQRGTSVAITASEYVADRWESNDGNGGAATISRQLHTIGQTDVPGNPRYFFQHQQTTGATSGGGPSAWQKVEDVATLSGQTVTITFYARITSGSLNMDIGAYQDFGTGGSPSTQVTTVVASAVALSTSWAKYQYVFTLPSVSGKTRGSNGDDFTGFYIIFPDLNETFTFQLSHVSMVAGDVSNEDDPFGYRPLQQELALCQRYYWEMPGNGSYAFAAGTTSVRGNVTFPVEMRSSPTATLLSSSPTVLIAGASQTGSSSTLDVSVGDEKGHRYRVTGMTGLTSGSAGQWNDTDPILSYDAEL